MYIYTHADFVELPTMSAVGNLNRTHIIHFAYPPRKAHHLEHKRTENNTFFSSCFLSFLLPVSIQLHPTADADLWSGSYKLSHLNKNEMSRQILTKMPNLKFQEIPFTVSYVRRVTAALQAIRRMQKRLNGTAGVRAGPDTCRSLQTQQKQTWRKVNQTTVYLRTSFSRKF